MQNELHSDASGQVLTIIHRVFMQMLEIFSYQLTQNIEIEIVDRNGVNPIKSHDLHAPQ